MKPTVAAACGVLLLGAALFGVGVSVLLEVRVLSHEDAPVFDALDRDTRQAFENARVAGVERGLEEARLLVGTDPAELDAILDARRAALEVEARSTAREIGETDARSRRAARVVKFEADRRTVEDETSSIARTALLLLFGLSAAILVAAVWAVARGQRTVAVRLGEAEAAVAAGSAELARTRRDLERSVDEKTSALAAALDESRDLNAQLKDAQEQLVRQEKMAALGTLAGGIAHEFNNLLGGIRGCAEDLRAEAEDGDARETLDVIVRAARRGRTIVEGLQTFSQAGAQEPQRVDLREVVAEVLRLAAHAAQERGVILQADEGEADVSVTGDPVELHQVVLNLVQNAVQASASGGTVDVELARLEDRVVVRVKDRGPGISPEHAPRVLEPFFTTRELDGGTGLGLAITHGIVQALVGTLTFEDREGGGTVFEVDLPHAKAHEHG